MRMPEKAHETINKLYKDVEAGNSDLKEKYTLEEIKQAKCYYKRDNSKELNLTSVMDDLIKELENICADRKREREKWIDRIIGFIFGRVSALIIPYLKGCLGWVGKWIKNN